jgi:23S rRNA (adenine2503-C2)-methyltransferase
MPVTLISRFRDPDSTEKFVFQTKDGYIEIAWIRNRETRNTLCLPTQYGCSLGCKFCHLGSEKNRVLSSQNIKWEDMLNAIQQVQGIIQSPVSYLYSFMGVGEPTLNPYMLENVFEKLNGQFAISTSAFSLPNLKRLLQAALRVPEIIKVHFSMHSPEDSTRKSLLPSSTAPIKEIMNSLLRYQQLCVTNKSQKEWDRFNELHTYPDPVEIHYTLIEGVNDLGNDLSGLKHYLGLYKFPIKFLKLNPVGLLQESKSQFVENMLDEFGKRMVREYSPPGKEIGSSCGQITKHYYLKHLTEDEEIAFAEWKSKYQV